MSETRFTSGVDERAFGRAPAPGAGGAGPVTYELASWGVRAAALLLDALIVGGVGAVLFAIGIGFFESDPDEQRRIAESYAYPAALLLVAVYSPLTMMRRGARNGQTLGKQILKIRVVRETGEAMTLSSGLVREVIGRMLPSLLTLGLYTPVDYLWPLWDRSRQCLHDKIASTRVVRAGAPLPEPTVLAPAPPPAPPRDDRPVRDGWLPPASGH